jgi:hypothetical protein
MSLLHKGDIAEILLSPAAIFFARPELFGQSSANLEGFQRLWRAQNAPNIFGNLGNVTAISMRYRVEKAIFIGAIP